MVRPRRPIELTETLEKVRVPSGIADRHGTLTWLNQAAKEWFGDLVGRRFATVVAPEYRDLVESQLERKIRGVPVTDYEVELIMADGSRRRAEISSVPIEGGNECQAIFGVVLTEPRPPARQVPQLTPRLSEVLHLLGEGASTDEIAASLHLSKETVRNYVKRILRTLGAHSRLEAVVIAHRDGLLATEEADVDTPGSED